MPGEVRAGGSGGCRSARGWRRVEPIAVDEFGDGWDSDTAPVDHPRPQHQVARASRGVPGQVAGEGFSLLVEDGGKVGDRVAAAAALPREVAGELVLLYRPGELYGLIERRCEAPLLVVLDREVVGVDESGPRHE